jgi:hypothetical protein
MSLSQRADALEAKMARELDYIVIKSRLYSMAEGDMSPAPNAGALMKENPNARVLMGDDPRLPAMPEKPTLMDFFKYRFGPCMHLLQSARHAVKANLPEKMVLACLLHDISTIGFIRGDHGYWGAQLVEPYVDEEVTWAIRAHQVLRFYPDESVGYEYPQSYITSFGQEYRPDPYVEEDYKRMRDHKWYMSGRQITVHDIYSFDPNVHVELEEFTDVIGRNFRQPEQGLGFDNSPVAQMWRAMIRPAKYLGSSRRSRMTARAAPLGSSVVPRSSLLARCDSRGTMSPTESADKVPRPIKGGPSVHDALWKSNYINKIAAGEIVG